MAFEPTSSAVDHPLWGKVFAAALGGAGVLGVVYLLMTLRPSQNALLILAAGLVAVALLLALYRLFLKWLRKRKAAPMTRSILANSSAAPHGISDPARRAKLDEMRKSFESGVAKFKAAGKDLYTLPWFVLVGEPGGGKTEAIRHSQVGFPHGLQDYMQGAGGTVNMNWWFTNHAIILDTAGRLMFEEVAPGTTNEWGEFLSLLRQSRPNCPINGMVLVIPADTLIKDSTEAIERKAGKIAQQLDMIQRTLDVRFPVFVLISKCDLISGFREFFETLDDPQLQGQILGWSNPASLDQPFNPEVVDRHLETVRQRLAARRYGLLLDPVHTEDPHARRIDQVDALFTFPDSLGRIGPRLRRYLEMIFVAGEWSPKPLFLRGIYFTSSMREGAALDAELAEVLKVPVDSLQDEGRSWERNKTYFLREPFLKKIFAEKGLVTRAARPNRLHRTRKIAVLSAGFVAIVALFALTATGVSEFRENIGRESSFWETVRDNHTRWAIVEKDGEYTGGFPERVDGMALVPLFAAAPDAVKNEVEVPKVFKGADFVSNDFSESKRVDAYRAVYETSVLAPLVQRAREKLARTGPGEWTPEAMAALKELVRLEAEARSPSASAPPAGGAARAPINLDPLFKFVLDARGYASYSEQQARLKGRRRDLQGTAAWFYAGKDRAPWPPPLLALNTAQSSAALAAAVASFRDHWKAHVDHTDPVQQAVLKLPDTLRQYADVLARQDELSAAALKAPVLTGDDYAKLQKHLDETVVALESAKEPVEEAWKAARQNATGAAASASRAFAARTQQREQQAEAAYVDLREADGQGDVLADLGDPPKRKREEALQDALTAADAQLKPVPWLPDVPTFAAPGFVYRRAADELRQGAAAPAAGETRPLREALASVDEAAKIRAAEIGRDEQQWAGADLGAKAAFAAWKASAQAAAAHRRHAAVDRVLAGLGQGSTARQVAGLVQTRRVHPVTIPLTGVKAKTPFSDEFDPDALRTFLGRIDALRLLLPSESEGQTPQQAARVLDLQKLRARFVEIDKGVSDHVAAYVDYWGTKVPGLAALNRGDLASWGAFFQDAAGKPRTWDDGSINSSLEVFTEQVVQALDVAVAAQPAGTREHTSAQDQAASMRDVLKRVRTAGFQQESRTVLRNWKKSQGVAADARSAILDQDPQEFLTDYVFSDAEAGFAGEYWSALSLRLLEVLAAASGRAAADELEGLRQRYDKFPLKLAAGQSMAPKDLDAAHDAVKRLLDGHWPADGAAGAARTIRGGNYPPGFAGDKWLRQLNAPAGDPRRFAAMRRVFDAFGGAQPAVCTIVLMDAKSRQSWLDRHPALPADDVWSDVWAQWKGGQPARKLRADPVTDGGKALGQFRCGPDDAAIEIVLAKGARAADAQELTRIVFPAPWAGPRMLLEGVGNIKRVRPRVPTKEGGETRHGWDVEVGVKDAATGKEFSLWLMLVFDKELPAPEAWKKPF